MENILKKLKKENGIIPILIIVVVVILLLSLMMILPAALLGIQDQSQTGGDSSGRDCSGSPLVPSQYKDWVKEAAAKYLSGDEAALITIINVESAWSPKAKNKSHPCYAAGLGQFCVATARELQSKHGSFQGGQIYDGPALNTSDIRHDPEQAIFASAMFLKMQMDRWGSFGDAYERGYHTWGDKDKGYPQKTAAQKARAKVEDQYNKLVSGGDCATTGGDYNGDNAPTGSGSNNVPLFKQSDPRWGNKYWGCGGPMKDSACGPTSLAMVLKYYGINVTPPDVALKKYHYCGPGGGALHTIFQDLATKYGLKYKQVNGINQVIKELESGRPVIAAMTHMGSGTAGGNCKTNFTSGGHFVVLTGIEGSIIYVNDPDGRNVTEVSSGQVAACKDNRSSYHLIYK